MFVPAPESPDYHFFAKPPERPRTHHLHVCGAGSEHELRHIAERDFLRAHDDAASRDEALKRQVVAHHRQDRLAYIESKEEFIAALEPRALDWARAADGRPLQHRSRPASRAASASQPEPLQRERFRFRGNTSTPG